jgi:uncharacterized protein YrrD
MIEELRIGAEVITADDKDVGNVSHIVVDAEQGVVTGIAVDPGLLRSRRLVEPEKWDEPASVIVPMDVVVHSDASSVRLRCSEAEFKAFPPYIDQDYVQPGEDWTAPPGYAIANFLLRLAAPFGGIIPPPMKIRLRKGRSEREIEPDTPVWREHPHTELGVVERVLYEQDGDKVQALIVRRGGLIPMHVVLPLKYVTEILDDVVRVDMSDQEIELLEPWGPRDEA